MMVWDHSFTIGQFMIDFSLVSALLIIAAICRRYIPFFQKYLIPCNLIAGFLGLIIGPELIRLVDFSLDRMGVYVYHLLALTFTAVGLRGMGKNRSKAALNFGFIMMMSYLLQAMVGLGIALVLMFSFFPSLVPAIGMLLPLGFGMGPGIAYTIGNSWDSYGFADGGSIGLSIAALGFLIAYFTGIIIVNRGIRKGHSLLITSTATISRDMRTGIVKNETPNVAARLTLFPGSIEPLTFHLSLIGGVSLLAYFLATWLAYGMTQIGLEREVATLWSFHFLLANVLAIALRKILDIRGTSYMFDDGFLNRITGMLADFLITTSIMAISLSITWRFLLPILAMCLLGTIITFFSIRWVSARVFSNYHFERFVGIYGEMTGTISSGLALIRVTDPAYETPVAQDLALGSGFALLLGFPLLIVINLPFTLFGGQIFGYFVTLAIFAAYLILIMLIWTRFGLRRGARIVL